MILGTVSVVIGSYIVINIIREEAKAPVLEGSGSRRLYRRKGTSVDRVYVVFGARVYLGFFTIRQKTDS